MSAGIDVVDPILGEAPSTDEFITSLMSFSGSALEHMCSRFPGLDLFFGVVQLFFPSFCGIVFVEIDLAVDDVFDLVM